MVGGAEGHLGFNLDLVVGISTVVVERGAHPNLLSISCCNKHWLMLFLPFLVPILVGHFSVAIFNRGKVVQAVYLLLQPYNVELACRDIGFQSVGGLDKTVIRSLVAE